MAGSRKEGLTAGGTGEFRCRHMSGLQLPRAACGKFCANSCYGRPPVDHGASQRGRGGAAGGPSKSPEVKAILDEHLSRHYESWVQERIPALGNRTPLQAIRTAAGCEAVEALVTPIERDSAGMRRPMDPGIMKRLRERLGLAPSAQA